MDSIFPRHGASRKPGTVHFQAAGDIAQRRWRRLNGAHLLPLVPAGVPFLDGVGASAYGVGGSEGGRRSTSTADLQHLAIPRHYAQADGSGLRCVGLRTFDQLEVHPLDLSAILAPERIDPLPLAVGVAVVPVVPPVAR